MPNLNDLSNFITMQIGHFERGKWDYIGLAQLYPQLEVLAQLVPRKDMQDNLESTVAYATRTESSGTGAKPGDPITPVNRENSLTRKVKMVKYVDSIGWTLDQVSLQGKSDEHIVSEIQKNLVEYDLHWWQDLENMMLKIPSSVNPDDDETLFGFPAYITDSASISDDEFQLTGGQDPFSAGRPGSISVNDEPNYTNPVAKYTAVSDESFFDLFEDFLQQRKLMGAVPNPRLLPDTPSDVMYVQLPTLKAVQKYLIASNENTGLDAGRYRGKPAYKGIPITNWHALGHPDSPVRSTTAEAYLIDWNSFRYTVSRDFDRKIEGPKDLPLVPSGKYITSEVWHQLVCDRPDRNFKMTSDNTDLAP